jgi:hypothetical protein
MAAVMKTRKATQSIKMKKKTESTFPAALEAAGMNGMLSPERNIEKKQTYYHGQQPQSQKNQQLQEGLLILQMHKVKEYKARFNRGQYQHGPNRQGFMVKHAGYNKHGSYKNQQHPYQNVCPIGNDMIVRFGLFHCTFPQAAR